MKTTRLEVLLDDETVAHLVRLESEWEVSRAQVVRRSLALAVESLGRVSPRTGLVEHAVVKSEPRVVMEERRPAVPAMMTGSQLARQQALARERRRGDETDQRPSNEEDL